MNNGLQFSSGVSHRLPVSQRAAWTELGFIQETKAKDAAGRRLPPQL